MKATQGPETMLKVSSRRGNQKSRNTLALHGTNFRRLDLGPTAHLNCGRLGSQQPASYIQFRSHMAIYNHIEAIWLQMC